MKSTRGESRRSCTPLQQELLELYERLDRLVHATCSEEGDAHELLKHFDFRPAVNVSETDKAYLVKIDLPEVKKEDMRVRCADGRLTVEGERRRDKQEQSQRTHRAESAYGHFLRSFLLPDDAACERIEASFKEGALSIVVPKLMTHVNDVREIAIA